jgi:glyoxylase-like metal-dependent hydrolase (beta-lactamase superfamily II)
MQQSLSHQFIGAVELVPLSDGALKTSLDYVVGMRRDQARALIGGEPDAPVFIPVNNFLLRLNGKLVLIDAGAGHAMQPTLGRLPQQLRAAGAEPAEIDAIVLTHIHPDHANGLLDEAGRKRFPNADVFVHEIEASFWLDVPAETADSPGAQRYRATAQKVMAPYRERIRRVSEGEQVLGSLVPMLAEGHTRGHTAWLLRDGLAAMLFWGDLVHLAAVQIPYPDVTFTYDLDEDAARQTRHRLFDFAVEQQVMIGGAHVDAPGIGSLLRQEQGYRFELTA